MPLLKSSDFSSGSSIIEVFNMIRSTLALLIIFSSTLFADDLTVASSLGIRSETVAAAVGSASSSSITQTDLIVESNEADAEEEAERKRVAELQLQDFRKEIEGEVRKALFFQPKKPEPKTAVRSIPANPQDRLLSSVSRR